MQEKLVWVFRGFPESLGPLDLRVSLDRWGSRVPRDQQDDQVQSVLQGVLDPGASREDLENKVPWEILEFRVSRGPLVFQDKREHLGCEVLQEPGA